MSNYRAGADLERAARKVLQDNGYLVIRSAGSKTPVDLVAFKRGEVLFVQAKTDGYLLPRERAAFWELAKSVDAWPIVVSWRKTGREARTLAFEVFGRLDGVRTDWSPDWAVA